MKITLKFINGNANGANEILEYPTVKEAEKFLNEALYYADSVELSSSYEDLITYDKDTVLSDMMRDAKTYGEGYINVYQIHEY